MSDEVFTILACAISFVAGYVVSYASYRIFTEASKNALNRQDIIMVRQAEFIAQVQPFAAVKHEPPTIEEQPVNSRNLDNLQGWINEGRPVNDTGN